MINWFLSELLRTHNGENKVLTNGVKAECSLGSKE